MARYVNPTCGPKLPIDAYLKFLFLTSWMDIYIYIYTYMCVCAYTHMYIYTPQKLPGLKKCIGAVDVFVLGMGFLLWCRWACGRKGSSTSDICFEGESGLVDWDCGAEPIEFEGFWDLDLVLAGRQRCTMT